MRLSQHGMIHQFMIGKLENLSVNVYFVEEEDGMTLIDTAMPAYTEQIVQAAKQFNKPLTRIAITHAHHDHLHGLDAVKQAFPSAVVYIAKREEPLTRGDVSLEPHEPNTPIVGSFAKGLTTKADVLIQDGDRIGSLHAIAVPGHTPGSMAFLDERTQAIVAGDTFQMIGGLAVAGVLRPIFPMMARGTWNKELALASARKLRALQPSLLAVGHGALLPDPCEAMDVAIEEADLHLQAAAANKEKPASVASKVREAIYSLLDKIHKH